MESKGALLTVAIPLIVFKIWFAILLLTYAPTRDGMVWIAATHWPLVIVIGLLIYPGVATFRIHGWSLEVGQAAQSDAGRKWCSVLGPVGNRLAARRRRLIRPRR